MKTLTKIAALGAALMISMSPVAAKELGVFQTTDRKMDFQLSTCGSGTDLCVKLLAARGSALTHQVRPYVGKLVVNKAKSSGENSWRGQFQQGDIKVTGKMKLSPGKNFVISGCAYVVMCDDFTLIPAR